MHLYSSGRFIQDRCQPEKNSSRNKQAKTKKTTIESHVFFLKRLIKIQYVHQGGCSGLRPQPSPFCVKSAGRPRSQGAIEACNTGSPKPRTCTHFASPCDTVCPWAYRVLQVANPLNYGCNYSGDQHDQLGPHNSTHRESSPEARTVLEHYRAGVMSQHHLHKLVWSWQGYMKPVCGNLCR